MGMLTAWLNSTFRYDFGTKDLQAAGAPTPADSTPTIAVYEDANDTALTLSGATVTLRSGTVARYRLAIPWTVANGFEMWKTYSIWINATVNDNEGEAPLTVMCLPPLALDYNISFVGSAVSGSGTTVVLDSSASTEDSRYLDMRIVKVSGTYGIEARPVFGYSGVNRTVTVAPAWLHNPVSGDIIVMYADVMGTGQALSDSELAGFQALCAAADPGTGEIPVLGSSVAAGVLNALASSYNTSLTIGNKINSAASAGDPWSTSLSGYGSGTAGKLINDMATFVNTLVARVGAWTGTGVNTLLGAFKALFSKTASAPSDIGGTFDPTTDSTEALRDNLMLASSYTAPANSTIAAIDAKTTNLPSSPAAVNSPMTLTSGERTAIAAAVSATFTLKKNTAGQTIPFYLRDASNPFVGLTGTPSVTVAHDASGSFVPVTGTLVNQGSGRWILTTSQADVNGDFNRFQADLAGAISDIVNVYCHA